MNNDSVKTGKVKFFNVTKGYGFIIEDNTDKEVFVHATGIIGAKELSPDTRVSFDVQDGKKGPNAVNVQVLN